MLVLVEGALSALVYYYSRAIKGEQKTEAEAPHHTPTTPRATAQWYFASRRGRSEGHVEHEAGGLALVAREININTRLQQEEAEKKGQNQQPSSSNICRELSQKAC